jgi:ADP-ribosylglycohydrolase
MATSVDAAVLDRARGVLLASAVGDALGAGYEFAPVSPDTVVTMKGGGLGGFAPGEWTDDTAQAWVIADVAATGVDLRSDDALDAIARGFADWYAGDPADVGTQTRAVLGLAGRTPTGASMAEAAQAVHERQGRSAGNGSLMRTGPVALAYLDDPEGLVEAASAISALTHYEDRARQACAVWCLMIRHAVRHGAFPTFDDVRPYLPNAEYWAGLLSDAEQREPREFSNNAWSVGALQAAWSAVVHTPVPADTPSRHLPDSLITAVRIGYDTDTVAAIAGALLGARWGFDAVPPEWRRIAHGWPGRRGQDYAALADKIVAGSAS